MLLLWEQVHTPLCKTATMRSPIVEAAAGIQVTIRATLYNRSDYYAL